MPTAGVDPEAFDLPTDSYLHLQAGMIPSAFLAKQLQHHYMP